jgi:hypothetical protein
VDGGICAFWGKMGSNLLRNPTHHFTCHKEIKMIKYMKHPRRGRGMSLFVDARRFFSLAVVCEESEEELG